MQFVETIFQSIQSMTASFFSNLLAFIDSMLVDRASGLILALVVGAIVMGLIVWAVMIRSRRIKCENIQTATDEYCARLRNQLRNKVERLDVVEKTLQEKDRALTMSERERAELAKQFVKIEELSASVQSELGSVVAGQSIPKQDMSIGQMAANLQKKLEGLHNQIVQQAAVISELESEVAQGHENLAHSIVSKTQKLPEMAKTKFEDQVVKPLYEQIEGIREKVGGISGTVQALPHRTKESLDERVVHPLQEMLSEMTAKVSRVPKLTSEQFHSLVLDPLQNQLDDLKSKSRQFTGDTKTTFEQTILNPIQEHFDAMAKLVQQFPVHTKEQVEKGLKQLQEQLGSVSGIGQEISKKTRESVDQWIVQPIQQQLSKQPHAAS